MNIDELQFLLKKYHLTPNKVRGQNFLVSDEVLDDIIVGANIDNDDLILEVGPGLGALTQRLLNSSRQVVALEVDKNLEELLYTLIKMNKNLEVIWQDILSLTDIQWQEILDKYKTGISVQMVQLQGVHPPKPVSDSFNEVNRAKQEQEMTINEAWQAYNKDIYKAEGESKKMVNEAEGYAVKRTNEALGDVALFISILKEYKRAPQITKDRLYLESMESIFSRIKHKVIVDDKLQNFLPFMNLNQGVK